VRGDGSTTRSNGRRATGNRTRASSSSTGKDDGLGDGTGRATVQGNGAAITPLWTTGLRWAAIDGLGRRPQPDDGIPRNSQGRRRGLERRAWATGSSSTIRDDG
jgi:hypothetical protein